MADIQVNSTKKNKVVFLMCSVTALAFMNKFLFFYSFFIPYFMHIGITPMSLGMALSVFEVAKIISDVPTGILADRFGRKYVLIGGFTLMGLALASWIYMPNINGVVIGMALFGVSKVSFYGKFESYFYDEMKVLGAGDKFHKLMSFVSILNNIGAAASGFIALRLFNHGGYELVFKAAFFMILFVILPFFIFLMPNSPIPVDENVKAQGRPGAITILKNAFIYLKADKRLMFTTILTALSFTIYILTAETHRIILKNIGATQETITMVYVACHVSQILMAFIVSTRKKPTSLMVPIVKYIMVLMTIISFSYFNYGYVTVAAMLIYIFLWPFVEIKVKSGLHNLAKSDVRATLASFCTITSSAFNGVFSLVIGAVSEHYSYREGVLAYAGLMLVICGALFFFGRKAEAGAIN